MALEAEDLKKICELANFIVANISNVISLEEVREKLIKAVLEFNKGRNQDVLKELSID